MIVIDEGGVVVVVDSFPRWKYDTMDGRRLLVVPLETAFMSNRWLDTDRSIDRSTTHDLNLKFKCTSTEYVLYRISTVLYLNCTVLAQ